MPIHHYLSLLMFCKRKTTWKITHIHATHFRSSFSFAQFKAKQFQLVKYNYASIEMSKYVFYVCFSLTHSIKSSAFVGFVVVFISSCMFVNYSCFKWLFSFAFDLKMKLFFIRFPFCIKNQQRISNDSQSRTDCTFLAFKANKNT